MNKHGVKKLRFQIPYGNLLLEASSEGEELCKKLNEINIKIIGDDITDIDWVVLIHKKMDLEQKLNTFNENKRNNVTKKDMSKMDLSKFNKSRPDSLGFTQCENFVEEHFIVHPLPFASSPMSIVLMKPCFLEKYE
jgi:hypothetical protein